MLTILPPDSCGYCLKTIAEDGSNDEAWLEVRGKGAVQTMQLDVHHAQPWMAPKELVRHLRQIANQVENLSAAQPVGRGSIEHQNNVNTVLRKHNDAVCIQRLPLKFEVMDSTKGDARVIGVAASEEFAWSDAAGRIARERVPGPPDPPKGKHPREWG